MKEPWDGATWINEGARLTAHDPGLGRRLISAGLRLTPDQPLGWFNLGLALHQQKRIAEAIRAYRLSLEHPSGHEAALRNNLSQDLLLQGEMAEGWGLYEHRRSMAKHGFFEQHLGASWSGPQDHRGKPDTLLLVSEQGLGDTLQFCRFALVLQGLGYGVELFCQRPLLELLRQCSGIHRVTNQWDPARQLGQTAWVPLMSLPHRLGLISEPWPHPEGYLALADMHQQRVLAWRKRLERRAGYRLVALYSQGKP